MIRNVIAVVTAFIIGGIFVFAIEAIGHRVYPLPEGFDTSDFAKIADYIKTAPIGAIAFVLLAQSFGSFVGGFVSGLIAKSNKRLIAIIYGVLALIMASINLVMIPHPLWFMVLSIALPIPLSLLGSMIAQGFSKSGEQ
jgi:hypothetical protein